MTRWKQHATDLDLQGMQKPMLRINNFFKEVKTYHVRKVNDYMCAPSCRQIPFRRAPLYYCIDFAFASVMGIEMINAR